MTDLIHLQGRVEAAHDRLDKMGDRVSTLETNNAVTEVRMTTIQTSLMKIETMTGRIAWLIIAGIITAIMSFIFRGGLNVQ